MKPFFVFFVALLVACTVVIYTLGEGVASTQNLGPIEQTSGGTWTTRVQVAGVSYPLVGNITVANGTMVILQTRKSGSHYVCNAASPAECFKVRRDDQSLGLQAVAK